MTCDHQGAMTASVTFTRFEHELAGMTSDGVTVEGVRCERCGQRFGFGQSDAVTLYLAHERGRHVYRDPELPGIVDADDFDMA